MRGKAAKRLKRFVAAMEALQDGLGALTDIVAADSADRRARRRRDDRRAGQARLSPPA